MNKLILILLTTYFCYSCCTGIDKSYIIVNRFIDSIMNNPDSLKNIIDKSLYFNANSRSTLLNDDSLNIYIPYLKLLTEYGFIYNNFDWSILEDREKNIVCLMEEVQIRGKGKEMYINFFFETKNDRRFLSNIRIGKKTEREIKREFDNNPPDDQ